ncbi:hypothetical protein FRC02_003976 [Tulasnella sp. 418]|nr:hypothetical protein FRC02_003976 [Tulasnella sp. 418]
MILVILLKRSLAAAWKYVPSSIRFSVIWFSNIALLDSATRLIICFFSNHGGHIHDLKKTHPRSCEEHPGAQGACYISSGVHDHSNSRYVSMSGAAIGANEATLNEPPNSIEFDGL